MGFAKPLKSSKAEPSTPADHNMAGGSPLHVMMIPAHDVLHCKTTDDRRPISSRMSRSAAPKILEALSEPAHAPQHATMCNEVSWD